MPTFALSQIDGLDALPNVRIPIFKLETNGQCEYDEWRKAIEEQGTFAEELDSLDQQIIYHAQMQKLAPGKFKELSANASDPIKDFEFRTRNLRVYLFKLPSEAGQTGKVIVIGGLKKEQKADIARMRRIKKEYYSSLGK